MYVDLHRRRVRDGGMGSEHRVESTASPRRTNGDALIRSHASPYRTVGEFLANSSDANAYTKTAERPAPIRMTEKFVVLAVVRRTDREII